MDQGQKKEGGRAALLLLVSFWWLLAAMMLAACSNSNWFTVKRQAAQALNCDCGPLELEEISAKVEALRTEPSGDPRYYHARCCGREVYYECRTQVGGPFNSVDPPLPDQGPAGHVSWRCWSIDSPLAPRRPADPSASPDS